MGRVATANLKEGMTLAEDLKDSAGRFVLPRGAALTAKQIRMLKIWGIFSAEIEGSDDERIEEERRASEAIRRQAEAFLETLFPAPRRGHPVMAELFRVCSGRLAARMESGFRPDPISFESGSLDTLRRHRPGLTPDGLIRGEIRLASFPDIYFKIRELLETPYASAVHLAEVVGKDPSLSARLLRLVNSSFYGFPQPIESIPRAIAIIGTTELSNLALAASTMSVFRDVPSEYVSMRPFWEHAVACGVFSRLLVPSREVRQEERFFLAGLFHDLGRLVLYRRLPREMTGALRLSRRLRIPLHEAERDLFSFDHAALGRTLLASWRIPDPIPDLVGFHHNFAETTAPDGAARLHVADILSIALQIGTSGSLFVPPLERGAWESLGLEVEALQGIITQGERQIAEIVNVFFGGEGTS